MTECTRDSTLNDDQNVSPANPYSRLSTQQNEIRVLSLSPGHWRDDIKCTLQAISLDTQPVVRYEALSYTWGASNRNEQVYINQTWVPITDNLASCLRYLRLVDQSRVLWIDAICIDQHDLAERAQQVLIMGNVYARAARVLVWLGRGPPLSDCGLKAVECPIMPYEDAIYAELDFAVSNTAPSWWDRVWIVQEVVLAQDIHVHFGRFCIPWDAFCYDFLKIDLGRRGSASITSPISISAMREAIITRLRALRRLRAEYRRHRCFEQVVSYTNKASSSDPRDRVFSILSILHSKYMEKVKPDYESSSENVFSRATYAAIEIEDSLDILKLVGFPRPPGLPSWALDFRNVNGVNLAEKYGLGGLDCDVEASALIRLESPVAHCTDVNFRQLAISGMMFDTITISGSQAQHLAGIASGPTVETTLKLALCSLMKLRGYEGLHTPEIRLRKRPLKPDVRARLDHFLRDCEYGSRGLLDILQEAFSLWHDILALPKWIPEHHNRIKIDIMRFLQYASTAVRGKGAVCFSTSNGFLGLAPDNIMQGDVISLLRGSKLPVVLRPREDGCFEFCGLAFVNGIMFGELLEMCEDIEFEEREFVLC